MVLEDLTIRLDDDTELRLPREEDAREVFDLIDRERDRFEPWMEWVHTFHTVEHELEFIRTRLAQQAVGSAIQFFVWHKGRIAGSIGTVVIDRENEAAEIGYMIFREHEGTGLAYRSVVALITHLIEVEGIHRIVAKVMPANTRSIDLVRRLGFTYEGVQRETYKLKGRYEDLGVHSILADEWRVARNDGR
jgi:ribosomal-protein-serine acetyltransferase